MRMSDAHNREPTSAMQCLETVHTLLRTRVPPTLLEVRAIAHPVHHTAAWRNAPPSCERIRCGRTLRGSLQGFKTYDPGSEVLPQNLVTNVSVTESNVARHSARSKV